MKKYQYLASWDDQTLTRVGEPVVVRGDSNVSQVEVTLPSNFLLDPTKAECRMYFLLPGEKESGFETLETATKDENGDSHVTWTIKHVHSQKGGRLAFSLTLIGDDAQWDSRTAIIPVYESRYQPESEEAEEPYTGRLTALEGSMASIRGEFGDVVDEFEELKETATLGAPIPKSLASEMVEGGVYLYTGTEPGYTAGHVYYYVNGTLTDGGVYGGTNIDDTLTISGQAADAKVTGDKIEEIKANFDDVFDKGFVLTNVTDISDVVKLENRSFLAEDQNQRIVGQPLSTFDSYYFYTSADAAVYFASATQDSPSYVTITVGYNPTGEWVEYTGGNIGMGCSSALRKRNIESNLPIQEYPLDISNAIVIITVDKTKTTDLYLNSKILIRDNVEYPRIEQEIQDINDKLPEFGSAVGTVTGYGNKLIVRINNAQYEIRHVTNQSTRTDTWRVFSGAISTGDSYEILWNGQDADGVVKLLGEDDFIGGFHGDEIIRDNGNAFSVLIDGVKQPSTAFDQKTFREMVIYQESDIYHCNTSSVSANVAFIRNKEIVFNKEGLKIKNYWIAQETVNVIRAFFGMLTVLLYQSDGVSIMCNGYSTDVDYAYNSADTTTPISPNMREVIMHSAFGNISIKMSNNTETNYRGYVEYYKTGDLRTKTYLGPVNNDSGITLNANDVLRGETLIQVRK